LGLAPSGPLQAAFKSAMTDLSFGCRLQATRIILGIENQNSTLINNLCIDMQMKPGLYNNNKKTPWLYLIIYGTNECDTEQYSAELSRAGSNPPVLF
jgi:hypothetical protein